METLWDETLRFEIADLLCGSFSETMGYEKPSFAGACRGGSKLRRTGKKHNQNIIKKFAVSRPFFA